ncbi:LytR/AlgR family response regulator transcription factor [Bowmanella dokdonensis]|uniref:LytTR family transcriptional regulator n=1 Tax=Bowmanella dokdonensis TaxID=751969 RepID=A0A939IRV5_9ALTE|nr:LytTR family DNA-binding domain-containing protein [Bowmanella dokdonensis]MBN7826484.1 LytTR family transcriptional regulator [Bowmanella dokdonensis]
MSGFERFERHHRLYVFLIFLGYLLITNSINATSVWMEANRSGSPGIALWEPFVWEYTSTLSVILLLPGLIWLFKKNPPRMTRTGSLLLTHLLGTLVFSILHVAIMVWLREGIYLLAGGDYRFGPVFREFLYEYRKDAWGYLFFYALFYLYNFVYSRLKGEAQLIEQQQDNGWQTAPEHLLVKKLDREFLVKVADIEWLESSGNYVNLHSGGRIYPLRATLSSLMERLGSAGFSRIHRSYAVNHHAIESISYQPSGDGDIRLKNGQTLNLSRRYKDEFKQKFG